MCQNFRKSYASLYHVFMLEIPKMRGVGSKVNFKKLQTQISECYLTLNNASLVNFNHIYLPLLQHCRIHSEGLFVEPEVSVVVPLHFFAVFPTIQLLYKYLELNTHTLIDNFL